MKLAIREYVDLDNGNRGMIWPRSSLDGGGWFWSYEPVAVGCSEDHGPFLTAQEAWQAMIGDDIADD